MSALMHYVLFRMKDGALTQKVKDDFENTFAALKSAMSEDIIDATVKFNCVRRDANMDVMVILKLASRESLTKYIPHPLHKDFAKRTDPILISRCSFDCEL